MCGGAGEAPHDFVLSSGEGWTLLHRCDAMLSTIVLYSELN